jgi:regulator of replication initiation timing
MAKCEMLSEFGNYLGQIVEFSRTVNQVSIQFQLHKLMQEKKQLQLESRKLVDL